MNNLYGLVNSKGNIIVQNKYNYIGEFSEGIAAVKFNGKWGFVNTKWEIVVPCEYDEFESNFKKGTGKLVKDGYICVFDKSGMQIRHMKKRNDSEDYYDDGNVDFFIEYQGRQHYEASSKFGGNRGFHQ